MNIKHLASASLFACVFIGAGCAPAAAPAPSSTAGTEQPAANVAQPAPAAAADPYAGWGEIQPGSVVSLRIPPGCYGDPGAGNIYVTCGADRGNADKTVMHTSSDGLQVNIRRGAVADWDQWDKVIASMKVLAPLGRDVQINISK